MRRVTILKKVRKNIVDNKDYHYLCIGLGSELANIIDDTYGHYIVMRDKIQDIFPLFSKETAKPFTDINSKHWETCNSWFWSKSARLNYLDWLIEQYKDDKQDIRNIVIKLVKEG